MIFSLKYSEKRLICIMYFYFIDFLAPEALVKKILFYSCFTLLCQLHITPTVSGGYNQNMGATITVGG